MLEASGRLDLARAAHARAEAAWLDAADVDGDDYAHPLRVALDAADAGLLEAQEAFDAAQAALAASDELRQYALRTGALRFAIERRSYAEAESYARAWIRAQGGSAQPGAVHIEGEDGEYGVVEGLSRGDAAQGGV